MLDAINLLILDNGQHIRLGTFVGLLSGLILWETLSRFRPVQQNRAIHWITNASLLLIGSILVYFLFPMAALSIAQIVESNGWGLLNYYNLNYWVKVIVAFILLDLSIYFQHVIFHTLPLFWRFHRVHHSDLDCDASTGLRFHPIEMLISMLVKFITIAALGAPLLAVFLFEIVLNGMAMFTHANIRIPRPLNRVLLWFMVTPNMHLIHHSNTSKQMNSNFGFNISLWDRLFGTYLDLPEQKLKTLDIGLGKHQDLTQQSLRGLLYLPFTGRVKGYTINERDFTQE